MKIKLKHKNYKRLAVSQKKQILREAYLKMPKSIQKLKKSLSINNYNLSQFIKCIKEPTQPHSKHSVNFYKSKTQDIQYESAADQKLKGLKNIVKNIDNFSIKKQKNAIFEKRLTLKNHKKMKQLKMHQSFLNFDADRAIENIFQQKGFRHFTQYSDSYNDAFTDSHSKKKFKIVKKPVQHFSDDQRPQTSFSTKERPPRSNKLYQNQRFWKTTSKSHSTSEHKWRTEGNQKIRQKNLGGIINFSHKRQEKQLNKFALQLQLNILGYKQSLKRWQI